MMPVGGLAVRPPAGAELRPLSRDDVGAAVALARAAHGLPTVTDAAELQRRFDALLGDIDVVPYGIQAEGRLAGLVVLRFRRRLNYATFEGSIADLVVEPGLRRRGLGSALLQAAIAEWRLRGGHRLGVHVPQAGEAAGQLLAAMGFADSLIDLRLVPGAQSALPVPGLLIREPRAEDGEIVTRLIAEFGPQRSPVPDRLEAVLRTFRAHLAQVADGRAASRVAEVDGSVVGVCTLEWQRPFWTDAVHAWLPDLVVTEPMRGRGIGRALLHSAIGLVRERGATELRLETAPHRAAARALYRTTGFEEVGRTAILYRDEGGGPFG